MTEIKPTWTIAQQISRRHTAISLKIALPLFFASLLIPVIILKVMGYSHPGKILHDFLVLHSQGLLVAALFIHFIPINFYAIKRLFQEDFADFKIRLLNKD